MGDGSEASRGEFCISGVNLSRNRGHQNALLAGIAVAAEHADMIVSMDADLQDDVDAMDRMIDAYETGNDIVYGVRSSRQKDTFFKRNTAQLFYRMLHFLGAEIVYNHADYRLLSRRAAKGLLSFEEVNLFLRGIVPMVGYQSTTVTYERGERFAGESKYPLGKMVAFALEGVTSLSVKPIRMITMGGLFVCLVSLGMLIKAFVGLRERQCGTGVDKCDYFHLGARRSAAVCDWNYRRVYREDVYGDETGVRDI